MTSNTIPVGEQVYEFTANFMGLTEFGASMEAIASGQATPPPEGARFDVAFQGTLTGDKINGTSTGVDYLNMRADGRTDLHIHATITTDDGANISYYADGVATPSETPGVLEIRENSTFTTSSEKYSWLNALPVWSTGTVDPANGLIKVKAYVA